MKESAKKCKSLKTYYAQPTEVSNITSSSNETTSSSVSNLELLNEEEGISTSSFVVLDYNPIDSVEHATSSCYIENIPNQIPSCSAGGNVTEPGKINFFCKPKKDEIAA